MEELNKYKYIYFGNITEPEENELAFTVYEAVVSEQEKDIVFGEATIEGTKEIITTKNSKSYQIYFPSYIAYSVINESYTSADEYEQFEGSNYRVYSKSRFLDYVSQDTIATSDYPGPFKHYGFVCLNHIIDIASQDEPIIEEL